MNGGDYRRIINNLKIGGKGEEGRLSQYYRVLIAGFNIF